jgi:hypothetical protein
MAVDRFGYGLGIAIPKRTDGKARAPKTAKHRDAYEDSDQAIFNGSRASLVSNKFSDRIEH